MIQKFISLPHIVEAIQYTGQNDHEMQLWGEGHIVSSPVCEPTIENPTGSYLQIYNPYRNLTAIVGQWVVKEQNGLFFSMNEDRFKATYQDHVTTKIL